MPEDKKHTPLPWYEAYNSYNGGFTIKSYEAGQNDAYVTDTKMDDVYISEANAEFIVRACNSHYELLKLAEIGLDAIEHFRLNPTGAKSVITVESCIWANQVIADAVGK